MAGKKRMKQKPKKKSRAIKLRRDVLMALDLPAEMDPSTHKITIVGQSDLLLENHTGILNCTNNLIGLTTNEGIIKVGGTELLLKELARGRAYVRGKIESITFTE